MDPNEDTEWNEALRNQGILPPKPPDQTEQFEEVLQQAIHEAEQNRLENLNLDELAELEDDEDDEFLEIYRYNSYKQVAGQWANVVRQKRMQEMREFQSKSQFGTVEPLTKPDFVKEVTEASASTWVFVHLFKDYIPQCKLLAVRLTEFAQKYPMLKILKIPGDQCIEGYPDKLMPTILVYGPKEYRSQVVGLAEIGGNQVTVKDLESYAERIGALTKTELRITRDRDEDEETFSERRPMRQSKADDEDDDWE